MLQKLLACSVISFGALCTSGCNDLNTQPPSAMAHGAPGQPPTWAYSGKTGIGTSYEQYLDGQYSNAAATGDVSKVWFSIAQGIVTETMFGLIHEAQIKDMELVIQGADFVHYESQDTTTKIDYLYKDAAGRPLSLAYKITNTDPQGRYRIEKHVFTDPNRNSLWQRVIFTAFEDGLSAYMVTNPHVANTGTNDSAWTQGGTAFARDGDNVIAIVGPEGSNPSVGFVGTSDLATDLADSSQDWHYNSTGDALGNVSISHALPVGSKNPQTWDFVLAYGNTTEQAQSVANASLTQGYADTLAHYNGTGDAIGWEDYLAGLAPLSELSASATDGGKLAYASAMVLKAQEDKTHAGALIASLSNPWGDVVPATESSTGYKAVWPRDFYQVAMAFLAMGDTETPLVAFRYLEKVQASSNTPGYSGAPGWFLQKTHVDGTLEWYAVQLDQTAMPIMLGWQLWQKGILSNADATQWYEKMLRPAADFLADGGQVNLGWNDTHITPPYTQQERWEEQEGYSPSTTAAIIAGLVTAAEFATQTGDSERAARYLARADQYRQQLDQQTFTNKGTLAGDGRYYLRISQNEDPNDQGGLTPRNGQGALNEIEIVDPGFLELVRYGVHAANHPEVVASLEEVDSDALPDYLRVRYEFPEKSNTYVGWRRYGGDGYGERITDGRGYQAEGENHPAQRGRVWPFLTGERAHYELARQKVRGELDVAQLKSRYVASMEYFANEGLMLPEQVWDGVGSNEAYGYELGEGTNSATPLAWTHAEYIKLLRSLADEAVWDYYPPVGERYQPAD
ncbi:glucan 1,4-alpha-glucosidase [Gilvimarinus sp. DA14]|uniref:glucan 1,4-alpha-glucosidase n=1 Tax=Gilvimarinus sp. DA14 TaxID=2956798 RepID=UPI0020B79930|nr:glucan 1,4-alpha-glucosidase [Gilvimarinus sp. DA14]UTF59309.1 glucan 1,4-alpha-glucosidase [Gilvimarinus sp. DA14]